MASQPNNARKSLLAAQYANANAADATIGAAGDAIATATAAGALTCTLSAPSAGCLQYLRDMDYEVHPKANGDAVIQWDRPTSN